MESAVLHKSGVTKEALTIYILLDIIIVLIHSKFFRNKSITANMEYDCITKDA